MFLTGTSLSPEEQAQQPVTRLRTEELKLHRFGRPTPPAHWADMDTAPSRDKGACPRSPGSDSKPAIGVPTGTATPCPDPQSSSPCLLSSTPPSPESTSVQTMKPASTGSTLTLASAWPLVHSPAARPRSHHWARSGPSSPGQVTLWTGLSLPTTLSSWEDHGDPRAMTGRVCYMQGAAAQHR